MRINLAKVVPWLGIALIAVLWIVAKSSGVSESGATYSDYPQTASSDTARVDAYLDQVAVALAQPGVYVDPAVTEISAEDAQRLSQEAAGTPGPVRVAVLPVDALRESDPGNDVYYNPIAYPEDELVGQLYDRVGVDGTYAILVDAQTSEDGRSFTAYQYSEERPYYDVETALDRAVECCAPAYTPMLDEFLANVGNEKTDPWPIVAWVAGIAAVLLALFFGGRWWRNRRRHRREDEQIADELRPSLNDEVVELSQTVSALPAPPAGTPVAQRTRNVLDLVEEARHRLDADAGSGRMDTPSEVEEVVERLSDARYELVAIHALQAGQPVPERTAPCFFDPRHGPSVDQRPFTPEGGSTRPVPVCTACRDQVDAGQKPAVHSLALAGKPPRPYWDWDRFSRPYVNGYWQRYRFADDRVQRTRFSSSPAVGRSLLDSLDGGAPAPARKPVQFVWESSSGGGGGSWWSSGGSSRGFSGRSGSRRSFGGGSSRRSSRRSGGSRRF